jgi:recombination protein RecT
MTALTTRPPGDSGSESQIVSLLSRPDVKAQMALALPAHVTAERLARIALTEVRKNPKLLNCDQLSFMGAIMQCCQLGLEPGGALGHAYLIPFENRAKGITECQFIVGYRGMLALARNSGQIASISARVVHLGDQFRFSYGLNETIEHVPGSDTGPMTHVYAVAMFKDGGHQFEVMTREDVEEIRDNSHGYKSAIKYNKKDHPWITSFDEMTRKTVTRRLFKWLPVSVELSTAVSLDEQADRGGQDNTLAHLMTAAPEALALPSSVTVEVPRLSEQQIATIRTAMERRLNPVGLETMKRLLNGDLSEKPAEQFGLIMNTLQDDVKVNYYNAGKDEFGLQILNDHEVKGMLATPVSHAADPDLPVGEARPPGAVDATPVRRRVAA